MVEIQVEGLRAVAAQKAAPEAHAMETSSGVARASDPDGKSRGLLEDLGHKVEQSFEAVSHGRLQTTDAAAPAPAPAAVVSHHPEKDRDGKSRGLLEDLGHKVEQSLEAAKRHQQQHISSGARPGQRRATAGESVSGGRHQGTRVRQPRPYGGTGGIPSLGWPLLYMGGRSLALLVQ